jgi:hypothetical protein
MSEAHVYVQPELPESRERSARNIEHRALFEKEAPTQGRVAQLIGNAAVSAAAAPPWQKTSEYHTAIRPGTCCGWDTRAPFGLGNTPVRRL